jgi:hypothetical protein
MVRLSSLLMVGLLVSGAANAAESWYGIVIKAPEKGGKIWTIGEQELTEDTSIKVKTSAGRLMAGSCVLVELADDAPIAIETRPMSDCDQTDYAAYLETYRRLAAN